MRESCWLSDAAWAAIEPHLPEHRYCALRVDDRRIISGIIHVLKSGCRWKDCPPEYGSPTTVYNRFNRVIATLAGYLVTGRSAAMPLGLLAGAGTAVMLAGKLMVRVQGRYFAARGAAIRVADTVAIAVAVYFLLDARPS